jgi:GxxExxY protein
VVTVLGSQADEAYGQGEAKKKQESRKAGIQEEKMATISLRHAELTDQIIAAAIEVHRTLGPGFLEAIYERALVIEFQERNIPFKQQVQMIVTYRGSEVGRHRLDLIVDDTIIVELKTVSALTEGHIKTTKSYLKAARKTDALLLNFSTPTLGIKRIFAH